MSVTAHCHCGSIRIELPAMPTEGTVCNCSYCNRTGAVWAYFDQREVKVDAAHDQTYSASGGVNEHHFCGRCGGNTHGFAPDYSAAYEQDGSAKEGAEPDFSPEAKRIQGNLRMIDDFDPETITINHLDGRHGW